MKTIRYTGQLIAADRYQEYKCTIDIVVFLSPDTADIDSVYAEVDLYGALVTWLGFLSYDDTTAYVEIEGETFLFPLTLDKLDITPARGSLPSLLRLDHACDDLRAEAYRLLLEAA